MICRYAFQLEEIRKYVANNLMFALKVNFSFNFSQERTKKEDLMTRLLVLRMQHRL